MLQPKRTKYRKHHRGRRNGIQSTGSSVAFGEFGLKAETPGWLTARQIEAARRAMIHHIKREGQAWVRVFPDKPVSSRPAETRMGGGKGAVEGWIAVVRRGRVLFELGDVPEPVAREALRLAASKLPLTTRIVARSEFY